MRLSSAAVVAFATNVIAVPQIHSFEHERRQTNSSGGACASAVTLDAKTNVFAKYKLHPNKFYRDEVTAAVANMTDKSLATAAAKIADYGSFLWIDTIANIAKVEPAFSDVPCGNILGLVIYDLPGRDCAAKASNGELAAGDVASYKTKYIDPIVDIIKKHPNTAVALIIEPDSLPNLVTNAKLAPCQASAAGYREAVPYALKSLNLPNVVMYIDAGHAGWLCWNDNLTPGAEELAKAYKAAGSPSQVRGFSSNIAGWNAWDTTPGEFASNSDAQYNKCQNEKDYVDIFSTHLTTAGMPAHAIVDTGRNGVQGLRKEWGDWCNVNGAGFGLRPTGDTGFEKADAFIHGKPGGESDGTSDTGAKRYDSFCGKEDAFKPSPEAGQWHQAYFEMLVKNAKPPLA